MSDVLAPYTRALREACLPGIAMRRDPSVSLLPALGVSRLGGLPDLPASVEWPRWQAFPMAFVGQIALTDVTPHDVEGLLPRDGLLSFFVMDLGRIPRGEWRRDVPGRTWVRHTPAAEKLARREAPDDLPASHSSPASPMGFESVQTWPSVEGTVIGDGQPGSAPCAIPLEGAAWQAWAVAQPENPASQLLGHPHGCEYPIGSEPDARLLLSVDVEDANLGWELFGRNGCLFFRISAEALRAGRFDRATHKEW